MFNFKSLSPVQLSAFTAFLIAALVGLTFALVESWKLGLVTGISVFAVSFGLIQFVFETFIYRKIKLIYKLIYLTKANKREETYFKYLLPRKSIAEVSEDVAKWAIQKYDEIEVLEKNEAYRKEFLQNLAHEIKTPIFSIQGYVDILLDGAMNNPELRKKFLESTGRNVVRLVKLVEDLDAITKLESGEQPLFKQNFIIQDLIKESFEDLQLKAKDFDIKFSIKKGCEQPIAVYADEEKIRRVLTNLIENAIKYGKSGGYVIASCYKVDGKHVLIEISDDGMGIAEEHLSRIFERFYRTDRGRSRTKGGTGLGLAICKHIIEAHQQTIHARSKLDVGTTIGFTLEGKRD